MDTMVTYLLSLQRAVFKLLPMRENYDKGENNFLYEYLDNLLSSCAGAFICFPELNDSGMLVEVRNNIIFLHSEEVVPYKKWRSTVLRSVRLLGTEIDKHRERSVDHGC